MKRCTYWVDVPQIVKLRTQEVYQALLDGASKDQLRYLYAWEFLPDGVKLALASVIISARADVLDTVRNGLALFDY